MVQDFVHQPDHHPLKVYQKGCHLLYRPFGEFLGVPEFTGAPKKRIFIRLFLDIDQVDPTPNGDDDFF